MPVGLHPVSSPEPFDSSSLSTPRAPLTAQSSMESPELPHDNAKPESPQNNTTDTQIEDVEVKEILVQKDQPLNNFDDEDTDSYSKCFEENLEAEKRMSRSQSMPPDYCGDGDLWGDDADDDESDLNDHGLDRSISVPESASSSSSGLGDSCELFFIFHFIYILNFCTFISIL